MLCRDLTGGEVATSVTALGDVPVPVPAGVSGTDLVTGAPVTAGSLVPVHGTVVVRTTKY